MRKICALLHAHTKRRAAGRSKLEASTSGGSSPACPAYLLNATMGTYETIECPAELLSELQHERHSHRDATRLTAQAQRTANADTDSQTLIAHAERIKQE